MWRPDSELRLATDGHVLRISWGTVDAVHEQDGTWLLTTPEIAMRYRADGSLLQRTWTSGVVEDYDTQGRVIRRNRARPGRRGRLHVGGRRLEPRRALQRDGRGV